MNDAAVRKAPRESVRRTQAERSEAMRQRLIDATVLSLDSAGYAGTTVSTIITMAGVSRGAPIHHFPTKAALIEATAEHLIRNLYIHLGRAVRDLEASDDRLTDMIMASWRGLFSTTESGALMELMLASRRDAELSTVLRKLWIAGYQVLDGASRHYFEPCADGTNATHFFVLTHWLMGGMAMERHLTDGEHVNEHFLQLWCRVLGAHLRPKAGVTTPPPRPEVWDTVLAIRDPA